MSLTDIGGAVGGWFKGLSPQAQQALISGGFALGGGMLSGAADQKAAEASAANNLQLAQLNNQTSRMNTAAGMMGSSPLQFQNDRVKMQLMGALLSGQQLPGYSVTPPDFLKGYVGDVKKTASDFASTPYGQQALKFLDPAAMASAEAPYWSTVAQLNPNLSVPNLGAMGYGQNAAAEATGNIAANRQTALRQSIAGQPGAAGSATAPKGYEYKYNSQTGQYELKKKGGGFWSKLGKIASVAIPIVAAPFTGGASLAAISAGAGALGGLSSGGGLKGALMGAGMGAATGALGGFGGGAKAPFSWGNVAKAATAPGALAQIGGAAIGGPVGGALQTAGMFMPHWDPSKWDPKFIQGQLDDAPSQTSIGFPTNQQGDRLPIPSTTLEPSAGGAGLSPLSTMKPPAPAPWSPPPQQTALQGAIAPRGGARSRPSQRLPMVAPPDGGSAYTPGPTYGGPRGYVGSGIPPKPSGLMGGPSMAPGTGFAPTGPSSSFWQILMQILGQPGVGVPGSGLPSNWPPYMMSAR